MYIISDSQLQIAHSTRDREVAVEMFYQIVEDLGADQDTIEENVDGLLLKIQIKYDNCDTWTIGLKDISPR